MFAGVRSTPKAGRDVGLHTDLHFIFPRLMPVESLGTLEPLPSALQWRLPNALERGRGPPWRSLPWAMGSDPELQYGALPR